MVLAVRRPCVEICVLGSGSGGNSIYVAAGATRVLIDAGLSARETAARLSGIGRELSDLSAVLFTHDHTDHCSGIAVLCRKHRVRLLANEGTAAGVERAVTGLTTPFDIFETACCFGVGELTFEPFNVPHDASDPVGFVVSDGRIRLGVATDLGSVTTVVRHRLSDCDALVLECNHDVEMVMQSKRPKSVQQRILGPHGHLCNEVACELLATVLSPRLKVVFPAHLSAECNSATLAERIVRDVLVRAGRSDVRVEMTHQDHASAVVVL
jgi:phosphoribosyl 1,2-cyclic phosphodiesterase